jgi:hypothetical protein
MKNPDFHRIKYIFPTYFLRKSLISFENSPDLCEQNMQSSELRAGINDRSGTRVGTGISSGSGVWPFLILF